MSQASGEPQVLFERGGHIAVITLNRPHIGNALSTAMNVLVRDYWEEVRSNGDTRCTVITGAGDRHFCTGADVENVAATGKVGGGYGRITEEVRWSSRQNDIWKPTVCAVNGLVAGGGLHFVVDSDVVVAAETAQFVDTHTNVGMVGAIEPIGLAKRLPIGTALRMTCRDATSVSQPRGPTSSGSWTSSLLPAGPRMRRWRSSRTSPGTHRTPCRCRCGRSGARLEMPYLTGGRVRLSLLRMHWSILTSRRARRAFAEKREPQWVTTEWREHRRHRRVQGTHGRRSSSASATPRHGDWDELVTYAIEAERLGASTVWSAEAWNQDAGDALAYLAARTTAIKLGNRHRPGRHPHPGVAGDDALTLAQMSERPVRARPRHAWPQFIEGWHGLAFERPVQRLREVVDIVRLVSRGAASRSTTAALYQLPRPGG
jgi:hypothetical protein